jgi:hypothetical protein
MSGCSSSLEWFEAIGFGLTRTTIARQWVNVDGLRAIHWEDL